MTTITPFIVRITKNLHWAERAFLIAVVIGAILAFSKLDTSVLKASLIGLAITFFLYAYKPLDIVRDENEQLDFSDLLALTILPKVMWISSAISTIGIQLYLLSLDNDGYKKMLMTGALTIGVGVVLLSIFSVSGVKNVKNIMPIVVAGRLTRDLRATYLIFLIGHPLFQAATFSKFTL